jgi:type IV secretion system protein VirB1
MDQLTELLSRVVEACGVIITPAVLSAIVQVESGGKPYAVYHATQSHFFKTEDEAIAFASPLVAAGQSVDLGLAQINSRNLDALSLSVDTVFEPCSNLRAAQTVFLWGYDREEDTELSAREKLIAALSRYNTGNSTAGVHNGYTARVLAATPSLPDVLNATPPAQAVRLSVNSGANYGDSAMGVPIPDGYVQSRQ